MLEGAHSPGELNFEISVVISTYLNRMGLTYNTINDINGALIGAQMEFNRRIVEKYEDEKIILNGDIDGYATHT